MTQRTLSCDVAVVGSGFGGSLFSILAKRIGRSVVLLEKGSHPRFAIGESSSPLANLLLEELADRYGLDRIRPLAAWGTWQAARPELDCGLKRGFTFYEQRQGRPFAAEPSRRNELLVAASPNDEVADTHWMRSDVDRFLVEEAEREGVEYIDRASLARLERRFDRWRIEGSRAGDPFAIEAALVVDASGPGGFVQRALGVPQSGFPSMPETSALYTHFEGVRRQDAGAAEKVGGPPYPPDDAAVHHVFEDGWVWVLRFRSGVASAGVAVVPALARELRLEEGDAAWARLLERFPSLGETFAGAHAIRPFIHAPRLPFRTSTAAGPGWVMLPSAAAFVDPLLSTGFPLTLLGIARLTRILEKHWASPALNDALTDCAATTLFEADAAAILVGALWSVFGDFEVFSALTLLYFASASYAEAARRLGHPERAGSFLSADHPIFGPALRSCCRAVQAAAGTLSRDRSRLIEGIYAAIAPLDVAGLSDRSRRNWHPVEPEPMLAGAAKLGATPQEVEAMLARTGVTTPVGR